MAYLDYVNFYVIYFQLLYPIVIMFDIDNCKI